MANGVVRVVGPERVTVVVDVGDLVRDRQDLAGDQRRRARKVVGLRDQVPHVRVAPQRAGDAAQGVAGMHRVRGRRGRGVAVVDRLVVLVEVGRIHRLVGLVLGRVDHALLGDGGPLLRVRHATRIGVGGVRDVADGAARGVVVVVVVVKRAAGAAVLLAHHHQAARAERVDGPGEGGLAAQAGVGLHEEALGVVVLRRGVGGAAGGDLDRQLVRAVPQRVGVGRRGGAVAHRSELAVARGAERGLRAGAFDVGGVEVQVVGGARLVRLRLHAVVAVVVRGLVVRGLLAAGVRVGDVVQRTAQRVVDAGIGELAVDGDGLQVAVHRVGVGLDRSGRGAALRVDRADAVAAHVVRDGHAVPAGDDAAADVVERAHRHREAVGVVVRVPVVFLQARAAAQVVVERLHAAAVADGVVLVGHVDVVVENAMDAVGFVVLDLGRFLDGLHLAVAAQAAVGLERAVARVVVPVLRQRVGDGVEHAEDVAVVGVGVDQLAGAHAGVGHVLAGQRGGLEGQVRVEVVGEDGDVAALVDVAGGLAEVVGVVDRGGAVGVGRGQAPAAGGLAVGPHEQARGGRNELVGVVGFAALVGDGLLHAAEGVVHGEVVPAVGVLVRDAAAEGVVAVVVDDLAAHVVAGLRRAERRDAGDALLGHLGHVAQDVGVLADDFQMRGVGDVDAGAAQGAEDVDVAARLAFVGPRARGRIPVRRVPADAGLLRAADVALTRGDAVGVDAEGQAPQQVVAIRRPGLHAGAHAVDVGDAGLRVVLLDQVAAGVVVEVGDDVAGIGGLAEIGSHRQGVLVGEVVPLPGDLAEGVERLVVADLVGGREMLHRLRHHRRRGGAGAQRDGALDDDVRVERVHVRAAVRIEERHRHGQRGARGEPRRDPREHHGVVPRRPGARERDRAGGQRDLHLGARHVVAGGAGQVKRLLVGHSRAVAAHAVGHGERDGAAGGDEAFAIGAGVAQRVGAVGQYRGGRDEPRRGPRQQGDRVRDARDGEVLGAQRIRRAAGNAVEHQRRRRLVGQHEAAAVHVERASAAADDVARRVVAVVGESLRRVGDDVLDVPGARRSIERHRAVGAIADDDPARAGQRQADLRQLAGLREATHGHRAVAGHRERARHALVRGGVRERVGAAGAQPRAHVEGQRRGAVGRACGGAPVAAQGAADHRRARAAVDQGDRAAERHVRRQVHDADGLRDRGAVVGGDDAVEAQREGAAAVAHVLGFAGADVRVQIVRVSEARILPGGRAERRHVARRERVRARRAIEDQLVVEHRRAALVHREVQRVLAGRRRDGSHLRDVQRQLPGLLRGHGQPRRDERDVAARGGELAQLVGGGIDVAAEVVRAIQAVGQAHRGARHGDRRPCTRRARLAVVERSAAAAGRVAVEDEAGRRGRRVADPGVGHRHRLRGAQADAGGRNRRGVDRRRQQGAVGGQALDGHRAGRRRGSHDPGVGHGVAAVRAGAGVIRRGEDVQRLLVGRAEVDVGLDGGPGQAGQHHAHVGGADAVGDDRRLVVGGRAAGTAVAAESDLVVDERDHRHPLRADLDLQVVRSVGRIDHDRGARRPCGLWGCGDLDGAGRGQVGDHAVGARGEAGRDEPQAAILVRGGDDERGGRGVRRRGNAGGCGCAVLARGDDAAAQRHAAARGQRGTAAGSHGDVRRVAAPDRLRAARGDHAHAAVRRDLAFRVGRALGGGIGLEAALGLDRLDEVVARVVEAEGLRELRADVARVARVDQLPDRGDAAQVDRVRADLARGVAVGVVDVELDRAVAGGARLDLAQHVVGGVLLVDHAGRGRAGALVGDVAERVVLRELDLAGAHVGLRDLAARRVVRVGGDDRRRRDHLGLVGAVRVERDAVVGVVDRLQHGDALHAGTGDAAHGVERIGGDVAGGVGLRARVAVGVVGVGGLAVGRAATGAELRGGRGVAERVVDGVGLGAHGRAVVVGEGRVDLADLAAQRVVGVVGGDRVAGAHLLDGLGDVAQAVVLRVGDSVGRALRGVAVAVDIGVGRAQRALLGDAAGGVAHVLRGAVGGVGGQRQRGDGGTQRGRGAQVGVGHAGVALARPRAGGHLRGVLHLLDGAVEGVPGRRAVDDDVVVVPAGDVAVGVDGQHLAAGGVVVVVGAVAARVDLLHHVAVGIVDERLHRLRVLHGQAHAVHVDVVVVIDDLVGREHLLPGDDGVERGRDEPVEHVVGVGGDAVGAGRRRRRGRRASGDEAGQRARGQRRGVGRVLEDLARGREAAARDGAVGGDRHDLVAGRVVVVEGARAAGGGVGLAAIGRGGAGVGDGGGDAAERIVGGDVDRRDGAAVGRDVGRAHARDDAAHRVVAVLRGARLGQRQAGGEVDALDALGAVAVAVVDVGVGHRHAAGVDHRQRLGRLVAVLVVEIGGAAASLVGDDLVEDVVRGAQGRVVHDRFGAGTVGGGEHAAVGVVGVARDGVLRVGRRRGRRGDRVRAGRGGDGIAADAGDLVAEARRVDGLGEVAQRVGLQRDAAEGVEPEVARVAQRIDDLDGVAERVVRGGGRGAQRVGGGGRAAVEVVGVARGVQRHQRRLLGGAQRCRGGRIALRDAGGLRPGAVAVGQCVALGRDLGEQVAVRVVRVDGGGGGRGALRDRLGQHAAGGIVGVAGGRLLGLAERVDVRDDAAQAVADVARRDARGVDQVGRVAVGVDVLVGDLVGDAHERRGDGRRRRGGAERGRGGVADRLGVVGEVARLGDVAAAVDLVDLAAFGVVVVARDAIAGVVGAGGDVGEQLGVAAGVGGRVVDLVLVGVDAPLADAGARVQVVERRAEDLAGLLAGDHEVVVDHVVAGLCAAAVAVAVDQHVDVAGIGRGDGERGGEGLPAVGDGGLRAVGARIGAVADIDAAADGVRAAGRGAEADGGGDHVADGVVAHVDAGAAVGAGDVVHPQGGAGGHRGGELARLRDVARGVVGELRGLAGRVDGEHAAAGFVVDVAGDAIA